MTANRSGAALLLVTLALSGSNSVFAGDRELGQYLSSECTTCHQMSGAAAGAIPPITGWPEDQFIAIVTAYKTKQRDNPIMQSIAARLSTDDIAALATFFGSLPPKPPSH